MNSHRWSALGLLAIVAACSSSSAAPAPSAAGSCNELASICHGIGTTLSEQCHDLGHAGDDSACARRRDECLAACPVQQKPDDAGTTTPSDAAHDALTDAHDPACDAYCSCMAANCSNEPNYPFSESAVCFAACGAFSSAERACYTYWCSAAADGGARGHSCDHAVGRLGLVECP